MTYLAFIMILGWFESAPHIEVFWDSQKACAEYKKAQDKNLEDAAKYFYPRLFATAQLDLYDSTWERVECEVVRPSEIKYRVVGYK